MLPDFVDRADIGMVESRGGLRLPLESGQRLGVFGYFIGQKLQRDESVEGYVLSFVDNTHAAPAEFLNDAVVRNGLVDHWRESYVGDAGKSMKAVELALSQKDGWRKIPITLIDGF